MENNNPYAEEEIPRRVMPLIFLVDTSGSMSGAKISAVNTAIREALNDVGEISKNNSDAKIKAAALMFSSSVQWMYENPMDSESFQWQDLVAGGLTSLGAAYEELNKKLSKSHGFMAEASGMRAPAIILLSDGEPTDEYVHSLDKLKGNPWFKTGVKVAIAIGDDANYDTLEAFTGNKESVIKVHNVDQLKRIIHTVSVTASKVASQSASVGSSDDGQASPADLQSQMASTLTQSIGSDPALGKVDQGNSSTNAGTDNWDIW